MLLATFILLTSPRAQDLSAPISFTSVAKPATAILKELTTAAKVPLIVSGPMGNEILVIHVKDVPVSMLMKRIASATSGEWQPEGAGYRLIRTPTTTLRLTQETLARKTAAVKKSIDEYLAKAKTEPVTPQRAQQIAKDLARVNKNLGGNQYDQTVYQQINALEMQTPSGRLYDAMLGAADPAAIASLQAGQRIVFSSEPTRMQIPLAQSPSAALKTFVAEQAVWSEAAKKADQGNEASDNSLIHHRPAEGQVKALLAVKLRDETESYALELMVGDASGRLVGQRNADLGTEMFPQPRPEDLKPTEEAEVELSPTSKAFGDVLREGFRKQNMPDIPVELRKALAATDKNDPLSFTVSDALIGWAKAKEVNLVADLPDISAFTLGVFLAVSKVTTTAVQRALDRSSELFVSTEPGWAEMKPVDPISAAANRVDRRAMAKFLTTGLTTKRWSLEDMAAYALVEPGIRTFCPLTRVMALLVCPEVVTGTDPDLRVLRIFGSLTPSQRQGLAGGAKLTFRQITPAQQGYFHTLAFGAEFRIMVRPPREREIQIPERVYGFGREPTESMPNGLPSDGSFTMTTDEAQIAYAYVDKDSMPRPMTAYDLAWNITAREEPDKHPWAKGQPQYTLFRVGERRRFHFDIELTPMYFLMEFLNDDRLQEDSKQVPMDELPEGFRSEIKKAVEQARLNPGYMPGNVKPPPP